MDEKLFQAAAKIRDIPNLPAIPLAAQEILAALEKESIRMQQLVATIEKDPALTSRIVGVANSAYFGSKAKIYTVNDAVTRVLGTNNVFSIALSVVLAGPFKANKCPGFHLELYWAEALKTALLAQALAPHLKNAVPEMADKAYLCGLLHNLGLLVLAYSFPDKVSQVVSIESIDRERDIAAVEERLIGIDRRRAGLILVRKWHLPEEITAVIEHSHDGAYRGDHWQLIRLVALCARCSHALATGQPYRPDATALASLQLSAETVEKSVTRMRDKISEIHTMALMLAMQ